MSIASNPLTQAGRRKLGRGLNSLISTPVRVEVSDSPTAMSHNAVSDAAGSAAQAGASASATSAAVPDEALPEHMIRSLEIALIDRNPRQPRQHFDEHALKKLAGSISSSGLMQPIVVRPRSGDSSNAAAIRYQIIAGERRWRAAQIAGLKRIPALVREVDDRTGAELSLVENLQREDLNPMERADAFRGLVQEFNLTHQEISLRVGLDRSSITNHLRLHELDEFTKDALRGDRLTLGHAKVLLALTNIVRRSKVADQCLREGWSVRELERRVKAAQSNAADATAAASIAPNVKSPASANAADLERRLTEHLGTKVQLRPGRNKGSGRLIIDFYNLDQFEGLLRRIQFEAE